MSVSSALRLACVITGALPALLGQGIGNVAVEVHPANYTGRAPARLRFVARIELAGARTFNYHWERSDGAKGPVKVVQVRDRERMITVSEEWQLGAPGQHLEVWQRIHVNCGNQHVSSDRAMASVNCR
jgi:hypothetical protein